MLQTVGLPARRAAWRPRSFDEWRDRLTAARVPPVIAVAGSRGKTTVVRLLDAIFREAGRRTVLWTDLGVEANGRRQRGELVPWSRALGRLGDGGLDLAIQELDWATVHAVGLPSAVYPVVAVTNLCMNSDSCLEREETKRALRSLQGVRAAVRGDGVLVLNGEDFAVAAPGMEAGNDCAPEVPTVLVAVNRDTPLVRAHLEAGGVAAWTDGGRLRTGVEASAIDVGAVSDLCLAMDGAIGFQVQNELTAIAVAGVCGIPATTIAASLRGFAASAALMPGSFNVIAVGGATVVVDRPAPSWFLRPALRAVSHLPHRRLLRVVGPMATVPESDLVETGRLLGRGGGGLILHGHVDAPDRGHRIRQGIAANEVPPVVIQVATERQAIGRALGMLREEDLLFILTEQPTTVLRSLERARNRLGEELAPPVGDHPSAKAGSSGASGRN